MAEDKWSLHFCLLKSATLKQNRLEEIRSILLIAEKIYSIKIPQELELKSELPKYIQNHILSETINSKTEHATKLHLNFKNYPALLIMT